MNGYSRRSSRRLLSNGRNVTALRTQRCGGGATRLRARICAIVRAVLVQAYRYDVAVLVQRAISP